MKTGLRYFFLYISLSCSFSCTMHVEGIYFPHGIIPDKPLIHPHEGKSWKAVIINQNANLYSQPITDKKKIVNTTDFLEVVTVYHQIQDHNSYLIKRDNDKWGWMRASDLLLNRYCMSASKTNAPLKLILKQVGLKKEIPFRRGTGINDQIVEPENHSKIVYVFKLNTNKKFAFVGNSQLWQQETTSLIGWVNIDYGIFWDNQQAVYFKKSNVINRPPVPIFSKIDHLKFYCNSNEFISKPKKAVAIENSEILESSDIELSRFPVLEKYGDFYKIILIPDLFRKNLTQTFKIDIIYLINVEDLITYDTVVEDSLKHFLRNIKEQDSYSLQIGLAIHRRFVMFQLVQNLGLTKESSNLLEWVQTKSMDSDVFEKIESIIPLTSWREGSTRAIIVVGDNNDRNQMQKFRQHLSRINDQIKEKHISIYAINITPKQNSRRQSKFRFQNEIQEYTIGNPALKNQRHVKVEQSQISHCLKSIFSNSTPDFKMKANDYLMLTKNKFGAEKMTDEKTDNMQSGINTKDWIEGWVSSKSINNIEQLDFYIMMNRKKLDMFVGLLASLIQAVEMKKSISLVCEQATGYSINNGEKLSEFFHRVYLLPLSKQADVLHFSPDVLYKKLKMKKFRRIFLRSLSKIYESLHQIQDNKIGNLQWNTTKSRYEVVKYKPKKWWFISSSYEKCCWIPLNFFY